MFVLGKEVIFMLDSVEIHDEISKGFDRIEKVIREETAKMTEVIREAINRENYNVDSTWGLRSTDPRE